jgi:hypothetical protein
MSALPHPDPVQGSRAESTTRVDAPHSSSGSYDTHVAPLPLDLLQAIAGHDTQTVGSQLREQALELAGILRDKQRMLEQRESELNARSALLENELRAARLKQLRPDRSPMESTAAVGRGDAVDSSDAAARRPEPEREWSEDRGMHADAGGNEQDQSEQFELLEQQRRLLRQREDRLERRQRRVEAMHDEVTVLHREAMELRLASEQVWLDLKEEFPGEVLTQSMAETRARIADHYRMAHDALAQRKDELREWRDELNLQEQRLRQQRREIQMWADRRYDEIESRLAKLTVRERELDELESQLQRQSFQWQQQREAYRQQIEQLSRQLPQRPA